MNHADEYFAGIIRLAREAGEPFAAIIVDESTHTSLAHGINDSPNDPTAHSEIAAIRNLIGRAPRETWPSLTMYTTAEPCPMCAAALIYSYLGRVVYGTDRDSLYAWGWKEFRMRAETLVKDAQAANSYAGRFTKYEGSHRRDCDALFPR